MFIEVAGQKIYYEVFGSGKRILFLHGWGGSCESFSLIAETLSRDLQVILIDLPGFGKSDLPKRVFGTFGYADIIRRFLEELGINKIIIAGHSFGGKVALAVTSKDSAKSTRKRVAEKLILIDSEGVSTKSSKTKISIATFKAAKKLLPALLTKKLKNRLGSKDYLEAGPLQRILVKVVNEDLKPLLPEIAAPTLIIWGGDDQITPLKDARVLSEGIKNSKLEIVKNAGHFPFLDQPEIFCRLTREFVHEA